MKKIFFFLTTILTIAILLYHLSSPVFSVYSDQEFEKDLQSGEINLTQWIVKDKSFLDALLAGINIKLLGPLENQEVNSNNSTPENNSRLKERGVISPLINGISLLYQQKPVSSVEYMAYLKEKLNIAKPAYAQA